MKTFITLASLCAVAVFATNYDNIQDIIMNFDPTYEAQLKECVEEMKLDARMLDPAHYKEATLPSVEVQSCFLNCIDKKMGLMKSDGSFNESWVVLADDPPELQEKLKTKLDAGLKACKEAVGADLCKMSACFHKMPKNFWQQS